MRITGLATGLDVDSIVEQTMSAYRTKIDQQAQKKDISEIKQKLYTDIMKESKDFYNKYFDIAKSDSLLLSSNWKNVKFTSSSPIVKVTGNSEAKAENYKIIGKTATAASTTLPHEVGAIGDFTINGQLFKLDGTSSKNISDFNSKIKAAGINVSVRYTAFAGSGETVDGKVTNKVGLIFESTKLGSGNTFTIGGSVETISNLDNTVQGKEATSKIVSTININDIKNNEFNFTLSKGETDSLKTLDIKIAFNDIYTNKDKIEVINKKLIEDKDFKDIYAELDADNNIIFKTKTLGNGAEDFSISIDSGVTIPSSGGDSATKTTVDLGNTISLNGSISINGTYIDLDKELNNYASLNGDSESEDTKKFNIIKSKLIANGVKAELTKDENGYKLVSTVEGSTGILDIRSINMGMDDKVATDGENAEIRIENSKGGVYIHSGATNVFTVDGVTFDFKSKIETNETINISGETDTKDIKEKIINLFNDYNTLMEKLNTLTSEKKNKGYDPLTKEQRSELSEKEVELWDEKVKEGQLYKDSDLTRITNSLKSAMRTMIIGTGLNLEQIGITPVADYGGTKNGTFTIDETKLSKALETNLDDIRTMFISTKPSEGTDSQKYSQTGIIYRIKDIIYSETMVSGSALAKKAGLLGTATATDNTLTKAIKAYERKIEDMEVTFLRKEQLLYAQYAKLETAMNNYNSQQSSLSQAFGMGS